LRRNLVENCARGTSAAAAGFRFGTAHIAYEDIVMILRNQLLAALAAATCALAPAAFSQEPPSPPPGSQDPDSADVGEPAPSQQEELPPTTTDEDEQTTPGAAEEPTEPTPSAGAADSSTAGPIEDKKIEQFADAYVAVQTIQQKAAAELQSAKDPAQADKVKATAESDMIAAVERSGLQVPEFNKIVERMASDTEVRSRVAAKLQERGAIKPEAGAKPDDTGG
jgi:cytoskeletal protein RodZ